MNKQLTINDKTHRYVGVEITSYEQALEMARESKITLEDLIAEYSAITSKKLQSLDRYIRLRLLSKQIGMFQKRLDLINQAINRFESENI